MTVAQRIAAINAECEGVWGQSGVTSWERDRLRERGNRETLSPKQDDILKQIERKVFKHE